MRLIFTQSPRVDGGAFEEEECNNIYTISSTACESNNNDTANYIINSTFVDSSVSDIIIHHKGGFFDLLQILFSYVASYCTRCVLEYSSTTFSSPSMIILRSVLSWFWLCLNDGIGIVFVFALYQRLQCQWSLTEAKEYFVQLTWNFAKENIAFVRTKFQKEESKVEQSFQKLLWKDRKLLTTKVLPKTGRDVSNILQVRN